MTLLRIGRHDGVVERSILFSRSYYMKSGFSNNLGIVSGVEVLFALSVVPAFA